MCVCVNNKNIGIEGQHSLFSKGTVSVISSDPSCKDGSARFTTVLLKPYNLIQGVGDIAVFLFIFTLKVP